MGKVCRVCDKKFFLRAVYQEYANDMVKLDLQNEMLQTDLSAKEQELINV
jgi:hypothetical protein